MTKNGELLVPALRKGNGVFPRFRKRMQKIFFGRSMRRRLEQVKRFLPAVTSAANRFRFRSSDILLLPDSSWAEPMWTEIDHAIEAGVVLGVLQHDFIPLRHPEWVSDDCPAIFERWVAESLSRADFVLGVSETIAQECREELRKLNREQVAEHRVRACLNGADFKAIGASSKVRPEIHRFITGAAVGPYLTVGTIEPRKNQRLLSEIFDMVFDAVPHARFLIAGIVGWEGKAIADRIRKHPRYGENILLVTDMSDAELTFAYQHAKAVVFPSLAEGYGLPIAESIARGTRVFASNIPVHREIGGAYCVYFDPHDARALAGLLVGDSKGERFAAVWPPVDFRLPTWKAAAETMVETSLEMARTLRSDRMSTRTREHQSHLRGIHTSPMPRIEKISS